MDGKLRSGVGGAGPTPVVIDVEPLDITEALDAPGAQMTGRALARPVRSSPPIHVAVEHKLDRRRRLDTERKRRSRAEAREAAKRRGRRLRVAAVAMLALLPCAAIATAAVAIGQWVSESGRTVTAAVGGMERAVGAVGADVARTGAAVDAVGTEVRDVKRGVSGIQAAVTGLGASVAASMVDMNRAIAAMPDPSADIGRLARTAGELDQRIGRPAQETQVAGVLAAATTIGDRVDHLSEQVAALGARLSASGTPIRIAPSPSPSPSSSSSPAAATPPAACVPVAEPAWWARRGEKLEDVLRRWTGEACWTLVWKIPGSYEWEADATFDGDDVRDVVRKALRAFGGAPVRPTGDAWADNRTIVISPATDDTGG